MALDKELMNFLITGSRGSLKQAFLTAMGERSSLRKEISDKLDALREVEAQLIALEWFIGHGEELAGKLETRPDGAVTAELRPPLPSSQPFALPRAFNRRGSSTRETARNWRKL